MEIFKIALTIFLYLFGTSCNLINLAIGGKMIKKLLVHLLFWSAGFNFFALDAMYLSPSFRARLGMEDRAITTVRQRLGDGTVRTTEYVEGEDEGYVSEYQDVLGDGSVIRTRRYRQQRVRTTWKEVFLYSGVLILAPMVAVVCLAELSMTPIERAERNAEILHDIKSWFLRVFRLG